eukprot:jgi/Ulvmu1/9832/UM056_0073.1
MPSVCCHRPAVSSSTLTCDRNQRCFEQCTYTPRVRDTGSLALVLQQCVSRSWQRFTQVLGCTSCGCLHPLPAKLSSARTHLATAIQRQQPAPCDDKATGSRDISAALEGDEDRLISSHEWERITCASSSRGGQPDGMPGEFLVPSADGVLEQSVQEERWSIKTQGTEAAEAIRIVSEGRIIGTGSYGTVYHGNLCGLSVAVKKITYRDCGPVSDEVYASLSLNHRNLVKTYFVYRRKVPSPNQESRLLSGCTPLHRTTSVDPMHSAEDTCFALASCTGTNTNSNASSDEEHGQWLECFMVQEFCNRGNLQQYIQTGYLAGLKRLQRCLDMALDICDGLSYMHDRHVLHLDLKPQNILLHTGEDGRIVYKIGDFGLSQAVSPGMATIDLQRQGTAMYAPWEISMLGKTSPKADVYALALLIGEALTGRAFYEGMTLAQALVAVLHHGLRPCLPGWVPRGLRVLLRQSWSANRAARPGIHEFSTRLRQIVMQLDDRGKPRTRVCIGVRAVDEV